MRFTPVFASAMAFGCIACTEPNEPEPGSVYEIVSKGRLERSGTISLKLVRGADTIPDSQIRWSAGPGSMAQIIGAVLRPLIAGRVTVTAVHAGDTVRASLDIQTPPLIVFDMSVGGNRDLYQVALDGGDLMRLTTAPQTDEQPTVVGGRVVFTSYRDGNGELYSVALGGGSERRLTMTAASETEPALSLQSRLAFLSDAEFTTRLWLSRADGSEPSRAAFGFAGAVHASPTWSPAGDQVALMTTARGSADLYVLDLGTGEARAVVASSLPEVEPAWSRDGKQLAFVSERDSDTEIFLFDLTDRTTRQLTVRVGTDAQPAWLPDGRVVYVAFTGNQQELYWLDPSAALAPVRVPLTGQLPANPSGVH